MKHARIQTLIAAFLWLSLFPNFLWATPEFESSLSSNKAAPGQTIVLTVKAKWSKNGPSYSFIPPLFSCKNLSLVRTGQSEEILIEANKEQIQKSFEFELLAGDTGSCQLEGAMQYVSSEIAGGSGVFHIPAQQIAVQQPRALPKKGLIPVLLAVAAGSAFLWIRKRRMNRPSSSSPELQLPEQFIQKISSALSLSADSPPKDNLYALSSHFRDFLTRYFQLSCKLSESELSKQLRKDHPNESKAVFHILERIDQLKFAGDGVTREDVNQLEYEVKRYLEGKRVIDINS